MGSFEENLTKKIDKTSFIYAYFVCKYPLCAFRYLNERVKRIS